MTSESEKVFFSKDAYSKDVHSVYSTVNHTPRATLDTNYNE
jgi:hypothetical protein